MSERPDLLEKAEIDTRHLIDVFHVQGLNYWQILRIFLNSCVQLQIMADAEFYLKR